VPTDNDRASTRKAYDRQAQLAEARIQFRINAFHRRLRASVEYLEAHGYQVIAPDPLPREELKPYSWRP
jgi:hypothetical protein